MTGRSEPEVLNVPPGGTTALRLARTFIPEAGASRPVTDIERLERRLEAVERALTDGDTEVAALAAADDLAGRVDDLEARVETLSAEAAEREAAVRAVRGYVGQERAADREAERTAESALATAESLQERVRAVEDRLDGQSAPQAGDDVDWSQQAAPTDGTPDARRPDGGGTTQTGRRAGRATQGTRDVAAGSSVTGATTPGRPGRTTPRRADDVEDGADDSLLARLRGLLS